MAKQEMHFTLSFEKLSFIIVLKTHDHNNKLNKQQAVWELRRIREERGKRGEERENQREILYFIQYTRVYNEDPTIKSNMVY